MQDEVISEDEPFIGTYSNDVATFGDRVSAARERLGLSQERLARKLGVKTKTLQGWEEDRSEPRANKLQMLAGVLNVSIIWLMSGEGEDLAPVLECGEGDGLRDCLGELRSIRGEYRNLNERMGRLEKRLRAMVA